METDQPTNHVAIEIVTLPPPKIFMSDLGAMDEDNAAAYLSYQCRTSVTPRRLRYWRSVQRGPVCSRFSAGSSVWYRKADLDQWVLVDCARDIGDE